MNLLVKVITYGTFDLFHEGHYRLLKRAKALGDYLIVGVTSETYDKGRGKLGVVDSLVNRIENVRKSGFADEIIVEEYAGQKFSDIQRYGVDIFAIGSDWLGQFDYLKDYCQVVYLERTKNISSTGLRKTKYHVYRIGIIGNGRIANRFIPESKFVSGVNLQSVYNPHFESAKIFAEKWQLNAYDNLEKFYDSVDLVYIASPHGTHYEYCKSALEHGKHVLCEKPLALKKSQAEELASLSHFNGGGQVYCLKASKQLTVPAFRNYSVWHAAAKLDLSAMSRLALRNWKIPTTASLPIQNLAEVFWNWEVMFCCLYSKFLARILNLCNSTRLTLITDLIYLQRRILNLKTELQLRLADSASNLKANF